jgi:RNA polymerase sigma factor (TIGR02999 family)
MRDETAITPGRITEVLGEVREGSPGARDEFFRLLYGELRRIAEAKMRGERRQHTLQPTALVHEAYIRLLGESPERWEDRNDFLDTAARAMREILVDFARARTAQKRGGGRARVTLRESDDANWYAATEVLAVHEALSDLESIDPQQSRVVELRFFGGLTVEETAAVMGIGVSTVYRFWNIARTWLYREIGP